MPRGPKGEKRPADVIGNAVHVMRIATGEVEDNPAPEHSRRGGLKGGVARARKLSEAERRSIAKKAAKARWRTNQTEKKKRTSAIVAYETLPARTSSCMKSKELVTLAARAALRLRPQDGALACGPSRGCPRAASGARKPSWSRHLAARLLRRLRPVQHRAQAGRAGGRAGIPRRAEPVRYRRLMGRIQEPRHSVRLHHHAVGKPLGRRVGQPCGSISGLRTSTI
jgi:hypothetical protein